MATISTSAFDIQPGALLATAPAEATAEQLNAALRPYGLCLPIAPLLSGLSLAELVRHNAGGRRRLRHGPIGRYLRAAVVGDGLRLGGPTLKRSTGYGLNRAIAGAGVELGPLRELVVSLRPLPAARAAALLACPSVADACRLAAALLDRGLQLSALALAPEGGSGLLLAELEGAPAVMERQLAALLECARAAGAVAEPVDESAWARWEALAASHTAGGARLDLTLPRAALPGFVERVQSLARRYGRALQPWGDAGVGALHLCLAHSGAGDVAGAEDRQLLAVLQSLAVAASGALSTELGQGEREAEGQGERLSLMHLPPLPVSSPLHVTPSELLGALRGIIGADHLLTRPADVATYETDASIARPDGAPLAVALPASTAEVAALVRTAAAHGVPVVTRGAGSGLAGGATPTPGALILGLNRMDGIAVDREQMVARVGAGAITAELQRAAEAVGLFYPPDPSSQIASTIGGNIACNAGGPRCLKYGVTADYVLGLTAVLADGSVVTWGDGLVGQGPANGLAQLLVGSEGTLAVITEATLRLIPQPAARRTTMALFDRLDDACATVERIMAAGLIPAGLELMDDSCIAAVEAYLGLGLPRDAGAMLLMLADGEPEEVAADAERLAALAREGGARQVEMARSAADEAGLWKARRAVSIALARVRPNRLGEDISVPLPRIAECVRRLKAVGAEHGLPIVVFGHAGDGNLHPNILFDARDAGEVARIWPCAADVFRVALELGGTLSGEHGIGTLKRPFMAQAMGPAELDAQRAVKHRLDPAGLLNPGKLLPDDH